MKIQGNGPGFGINAPGISDSSPTAPTGAAGSAGFQHLVETAIQNVDAAQTDADLEVGRLARGEGNLHEAALSLEKADVSMRLMVKARNKIVEAYQEIMRMPV